jgi:hypothetical protein
MEAAVIIERMKEQPKLGKARAILRKVETGLAALSQSTEDENATEREVSADRRELWEAVKALRTVIARVRISQTERERYNGYCLALKNAIETVQIDNRFRYGAMDKDARRQRVFALMALSGGYEATLAELDALIAEDKDEEVLLRSAKRAVMNNMLNEERNALIRRYHELVCELRHNTPDRLAVRQQLSAIMGQLDAIDEQIAATEPDRTVSARMKPELDVRSIIADVATELRALKDAVMRRADGSRGASEE